jgi:hypothetical protein
LTKSRRLRLRKRPAAVRDAIVAATSTVAWDDLSEVEQTALKRMNRGAYPGLTEEMGARLVSLGLAVTRPDGIGISRRGRELVINTLLAARPAGDYQG